MFSILVILVPYFISVRKLIREGKRGLIFSTQGIDLLQQAQQTWTVSFRTVQQVGVLAHCVAFSTETAPRGFEDTLLPHRLFNPILLTLLHYSTSRSIAVDRVRFVLDSTCSLNCRG